MSKKVFVIGLGLIGASLCQNLKQTNNIVYGWDHSPESCVYAKETGIIDEIANGLETACEMDVIILAVPVQVALTYLKQLAELSLKNSVVVTDVGSTKSKVMEVAKELPFTFIGGHPMAGSHKSGVRAVNPLLFEEAYYILTPLEDEQSALEELIALLAPTKAKFVVIDPKGHDQMVGVLSHLPHIVASGLVEMSDDLSQKHPRANQLAAGGFRDITRIASSDPQMWTDILITNREILLQLIQEWQKKMSTIFHKIDQQDHQGIFDFFAQAKESRDLLPPQARGAIPAFYDLLVDIPDIAGAVAKVTTVLSQHHLSIINLKIQETREDIYGVLELSFKNQQDLLKGKELIENEHFICRIRS
ncbi:prephenate dehydrogenase [Enterococcus florum]|uniref:Prephenate dehydrogenase n=1 Tax=Enterococcus florum TaxID=2480627 RepID=A0A4P5PCL3_9ENTE|nr:prephenate dehydrogenase [Enterococcus florum]GCF93708.1 prephenate dehydrogenase [Enterococcus florum]